MPRMDELEVVVVGPAAEVLRAAGVEVVERASLEQACTELGAGTAALVVDLSVESDPQLAALLTWREREPAWSELPVVVHCAGDESLEVLLGRVLAGGRSAEELLAAVERARRIRLRQLVRRDRDHRDAISTLAHELRNPLAAITNAVYLLRHGGATPKVLDLLDRQVKHLVRVLEDVRDRSEH